MPVVQTMKTESSLRRREGPFRVQLSGRRIGSRLPGARIGLYGRSRHPWLTGSAGWSYVAATQGILGVRLAFDGMIVDPCIAPHWGEFQVTLQWRGATYHITVRNPERIEKGVKRVTLNGQVLDGSIPPQEAGTVHEVLVTMGRGAE
jgi:cellobiose phosphorylase